MINGITAPCGQAAWWPVSSSVPMLVMIPARRRQAPPGRQNNLSIHQILQGDWHSIRNRTKGAIRHAAEVLALPMLTFAERKATLATAPLSESTHRFYC